MRMPRCTAAKQRGRGNVQCYAPGHERGHRGPGPARERTAQRASTLQQFELYYQPKVDTTHRRGAQRRGADPLAASANAASISPAEFIPLAEECGLIGAIGEWVMREACRQARAWQHDGLPPLRVAVNLSASQFRDAAWSRRIRRALDDAGLEAAVSGGRADRERGDERSRGVDRDPRAAERNGRAGVGRRLRHRLFEHELSAPLPDRQAQDRPRASSTRSRAARRTPRSSRAIVSLAHSLRLKVVAEGVETPAQLDFLKTAGCDEYQGYHFSRPLPAAEFRTADARSRIRRMS